MIEAETPYSKVIELPDGSVLTLEFNDLFVNKVRNHFGLQSDEDVSDDLLKEFFAASLAGV